jgi:hypothetical protein
MKRNQLFLILFVSFFLQRCIPELTLIPTKGVYFYGYDLTKYSSQGFLITPLEYQGKYLVTGIFSNELIPDVRWDNKRRYQKSKAVAFPVPEGYDKKLIKAG